MFRQDFTCPALLEDSAFITATGLSPAMADLSMSFALKSTGYGLVRVRSPLLTESLLMSFPQGTEMFHFPWFAFHPYVFRMKYLIVIRMIAAANEVTPENIRSEVGFPIRRFPDQSLLTTPRNLSQCATSFFASYRQGIPRTPLDA